MLLKFCISNDLISRILGFKTAQVIRPLPHDIGNSL